MGKKPVLFVHAGSQKTGTTAIQQTLGAARGELRRQGICWPELGSSPVHHKSAQSLHDRGLLARLDAAWMTRRIRRQSQGCRATVLSSERLYRIGYDLIGNEPQDSATRRRRRSEVLGRLRALFADDFDIRVILYLLRVDVFAESMFKELLFRKDYRGRYLFARFLEEQDVLFRYDTRIREFEDCLGPVSVHCYDALKGTAVVPHFCSLIGATPPGSAASDARIRRSASNAGAWFLLQLAEQRDRPRPTAGACSGSACRKRGPSRRARRARCGRRRRRTAGSWVPTDRRCSIRSCRRSVPARSSTVRCPRRSSCAA